MKWLASNNSLLLIWVSLMASSFVMSENLLPYANAITSTGLRFILASLFMLPFILFRYEPSHSIFELFSINRTVFLHYMIISLFLILFFVGLFEALKTTTALRTSIIYTLVPLMSLIVALGLLKTRTEKLKIVGFVFGTLGAVLIILAFNSEGVSLDIWNKGDSIFIFSCLSLSIHVVLIKKWGEHVPAIQGAFYIMFFGALLLIPLIVIFGELDQVVWEAYEFWSTLLYLTVFTTMATFFLQQRLVKRVGPNKLLSFTYLIPILVLLPALWDSVEPLVGKQLVESISGIFLVLLALYLISKEQKVTM